MMKKVLFAIVLLTLIGSYGFTYTVHFSVDWDQLSSVYGGGDDGNDMRDVAFNPVTNHILITDTDQDRIHILNSADGTDTGSDLTTTPALGAVSYVAWLGPYGVTAANDGVIYLSAYVTNFGVARFDSETTPSYTKCASTSNNSRGIKGLHGVASANQILYVAGNAIGNPVDILTTADGGYTFTILESPTFGDARYGAAPESSNTGGDGDTIYVTGSTAAPPRKFDRSGGVWTEDTGFSVTQIANKCEVVYDSDEGADILFATLFTGGADEDGIWAFNGATGAVLGYFDWDVAYGAQTNAGNNAGIDVVPAEKKIYFTADEFSRYGRLTYIGGVTTVEDWALY